MRCNFYGQLNLSKQRKLTNIGLREYMVLLIEHARTQSSRPQTKNTCQLIIFI
jgi:hypothetical protein